MRKKIVFVLIILFAILSFCSAQSIISVNMLGGVTYLFEQQPAAFKPGFFGDLKAYFFKKKDSLFQFGVNLGYSYLPTIIDNSVSLLDLGGTVSFFKPIGSRFGLRGDITGGVSGLLINNSINGQFDTSNGTPWGITSFAGINTLFNWYVTPDISLTLDVGGKYYFGIAPAIQASLGASILLPQTNPQLVVNNITSTTVIPVFHDYYLKNPVLRIDVTNNKKFTIHNTIVEVLSSNLSNGNSINYPDSIQRGETVSIYVPVKWKDSIMERTGTSLESIPIRITYKVSGKKCIINQTAYCLILSKNNFIWQTDFSESGDEILDYVQKAVDGKVAVFINPNDKQFISLAQTIKQQTEKSIGYDELPSKLKMIYSIAAYFQSRQIKYQIDPNTVPYGKTSDAQVDYLRYAHETLESGYGDCDDLSILYASILEAAGVSTALITIPGHIFIAAESGLTEENVVLLFEDDSEFIKDGEKYWIPIEVTRMSDDLRTSWDTGINEWNSVSDSERSFFKLEESWQEFKPTVVEWQNKSSKYNPQDNIGIIASQNRASISEDVILRARQQMAERLPSETQKQQASEYSRLARREFIFGLLEDAYNDIVKATLLNPSSSNYYNAALIAKAAGLHNDAIRLVNSALAITETDNSKKLLATLIGGENTSSKVIIAAIDTKTDTERAEEKGDILSWEE